MTNQHHKHDIHAGRKRSGNGSWGFRDAMDSLLAGATFLAVLMFLYWNLAALLPDEIFLRSIDPLGKLATIRLALFLPLALASSVAVACGYKRMAANPGMANLLPAAAFATSLFVLIEVRWIHSPFPPWFLLLRAAILFGALPFGWWLLARKWRRAA